jgi:hypothetical protein
MTQSLKVGVLGSGPAGQTLPPDCWKKATLS